MMTAVEGMYGGLNALADTLQIERIGPMHQAGSDSLLTAQTFFELVRRHLSGTIEDSRRVLVRVLVRDSTVRLLWFLTK